MTLAENIIELNGIKSELVICTGSKKVIENGKLYIY